MNYMIPVAVIILAIILLIIHKVVKIGTTNAKAQSNITIRLTSLEAAYLFDACDMVATRAKEATYLPFEYREKLGNSVLNVKTQIKAQHERLHHSGASNLTPKQHTLNQNHRVRV